VPAGDGLEGAADRRRPVGIRFDAWPDEGDRLPWAENGARIGGGPQQCRVLPGGDVEVGGDGGDLGDPHGRAKLLRCHVRQADVPDQALLAQFGEGADLILE